MLINTQSVNHLLITYLWFWNIQEDYKRQYLKKIVTKVVPDDLNKPPYYKKSCKFTPWKEKKKKRFNIKIRVLFLIMLFE